MPTEANRLRLAAVGVGLFALNGVAVCQASRLGDTQWGPWILTGTVVLSGAILGGAFAAGWLHRQRAGWVLLIALVLRATALPLGPALSDDGYRYIWDGRLVAEGENPYLYPPDALPDAIREQIDPLGEIYGRLNSPTYYSVYPPPSQFLFGAIASLGAESFRAQYILLKLILVVGELLAISILLRVVAVPLVALYAWHPLPVLEVAGQGHTESLFVIFGVLALSVASKSTRGEFGAGSRAGIATALWTVAGWAKLVPLGLLPFLLWRFGVKALLAAVAVTIVLWMPFAHPMVPVHIADSLRLYVQLFEFNAGTYLVAKHTALTLCGVDVSKTLGPLLSAGFFVALALLFFRDLRSEPSARLPLASLVLLVLGGFLLSTTTVHPWYLLMPLAMCPLVWHSGSRAFRRWAWGWWWLSLWSVGTYAFYTRASFPGNEVLAVASGVIGWVGLLVATGAALLAAAPTARLVERILEYRGRSKWRWIESTLAQSVQPTDRVLDLGASEGWVGWAVRNETGANVILADVIDLNRTSLKHVRYDGVVLPLESDTFDLVLLVFVLHHATDPGAVLDEAKRVAKPGSQIVVVESVYTNEVNHTLLCFLDRHINRLRGEGEMQHQELHLAFDTVPGWRRRFAERGFTIVSEAKRGRWIHRQHVFVLQPDQSVVARRDSF